MQAGVADIVAFNDCLSRSEPVPAIEADIAAVRELGGRGTPTILINGLLLTSAPDSIELDELVRNALSRVDGERMQR
jgi:protein-disulfide isomerase